MNKPIAVMFAGVPGSSKSPTAFYLSWQFGIPMFSNDSIRFAVKEDLLANDINNPRALKEYKRRSAVERKTALAKKRSIILDSSVDRHWLEIKQELDQYGYRHFLISFDMTYAFMVRLFQATGRHGSIEELGAYMHQHQAFLSRYGSEIQVSIQNKDFSNRFQITNQALGKFLRG